MAEFFSKGDVQVSATALRTAYANGVLAIFGGTRPANANDSEGSAPLLCLVTVNSGVFTAGVSTNGLNFDAPVDGILSKAVSETWSGLGTAAAGENGTVATWCRFYANDYITGASDIAKRFDGSVGTTTSYDLKLSTTTIVQNVPIIINSFTRRVKMSA